MFESVNVAVHFCNENHLSAHESRVVDYLSVDYLSVVCLNVVSLSAMSDDAVSSTPMKHLLLKECAEKIRKVQKDAGPHRYIENSFIQPTSILFEKFFSRAGYSVGENRRSLIPAHFEGQVFLHRNIEKWGVLDVNKAYN